MLRRQTFCKIQDMLYSTLQALTQQCTINKTTRENNLIWHLFLVKGFLLCSAPCCLFLLFQHTLAYVQAHSCAATQQLGQGLI